MSLLRNLRRPGEVRSTISHNEYIRKYHAMQPTSLGSAGTVEGALALAAVWRSVNKIAGIVSQLPWNRYIDRDIVPTRPDLLTNPAPGFYRESTWKRTAATSMVLQGGVYGWMSEFTADFLAPGRIDLIDPLKVAWTDSQGWTIDGEQVEEWPVGPFWQVPYMTLPGSPKGVSAITYAARTTYAGLAAKEFGGNFFRDGAHPTHVISPKHDPGPKAAEALKERIKGVVSGTDRDPLVLPQDTLLHQLQVNPEDSQFIELGKFTGAEIAGFFGLMPEHIGLPVEGAGIQYSNRENRQADLLQDAIMPVIDPLEEGVTEWFQRGQVRFNVAGLLRADLQSRFTAYKTAAEINSLTGDTFMTVDEMRELEDWSAITDDDADD